MRLTNRIWVLLMELGALTGCHQKTMRSFFIKGFQFPVCARCTGIITAKPFAWIFVKKKNLSLSKCIFLVIPMIIDGGIQYKFSIESNNKRRFITGFMAGFALTAMKIQIIKKLIYE